MKYGICACATLICNDIAVCSVVECGLPNTFKAALIFLCLHLHDFQLRNRFLLTVISCPIYHWLEVNREEVSREVDILRARSASDISNDD